MTKIRFTLAQVETFPDERPDSRKRLGIPMLAQRGTADKSAPDLHADKVTVVRYRTLRPRERLQAVSGWNRQRRDATRTNNAAERATSGSETKRKTVRGSKSEEGTLNGLGLTRRA